MIFLYFLGLLFLVLVFYIIFKNSKIIQEITKTVLIFFQNLITVIMALFLSKKAASELYRDIKGTKYTRYQTKIWQKIVLKILKWKTK